MCKWQRSALALLTPMWLQHAAGLYAKNIVTLHTCRIKPTKEKLDGGILIDNVIDRGAHRPAEPARLELWHGPTRMRAAGLA